MSTQVTQEVHLRDYIQIISKRKFLILTCFLVTISTVALYNYIAEPIYETSARLLIDEEGPTTSITGMSMAFDRFQLQSIELQTHFDLMVSFPVLERVYAAVYLNKTKEETIPETEESIPLLKQLLLFIIQSLSEIKYRILDFFSSDEQRDEILLNNPDLLTYYKIRRLKQRIETQQVKNTRLVDLKANHHNPEKARDIANAFAHSYIEYTRSSSFEASKVAIDWLSTQMEDMKQEIALSEKNFYEFKQKEGIFSIEGKQQISSQKISTLTASYSESKRKHMGLSATIKQLKNVLDTRDYDNVALGTVGNPMLESLHMDLVNAEIELDGLNKTFKYKHAQIIALENKITQLKSTFEQELKRTLRSLQAELEIQKNEERKLLSSIQLYENEALNLTKKEMQYAMLQREVEANKTLYDLLFSNFTEANVTKAMPTTNITLLELAPLPLSPVKPTKALNLIIGTILGLMIGVGLTLFLDYIDNTFTTTEDLERYLKLPVLAVIPRISAKKW